LRAKPLMILGGLGGNRYTEMVVRGVEAGWCPSPLAITLFWEITSPFLKGRPRGISEQNPP